MLTPVSESGDAERQPVAVVTEFVEAFGRLDGGAMAALLAEDVEAHITNEQAGADPVKGRDALMERIGAFNYGGAELSLTVTNSVSPSPQQALAMVEVRAERPDGATLHNHAAHLCTVRDGEIVSWWMVEALPAESDAFWRDA